MDLSGDATWLDFYWSHPDHQLLSAGITTEFGERHGQVWQIVERTSRDQARADLRDSLSEDATRDGTADGS